MDARRIRLPTAVWKEVCLLRRRIEFYESAFSEECLDDPELIGHLKEIYADVDMDSENFGKKIASLQK